MVELTILLPAYNGMPYLPQAVESILNQTLNRFCLIIIDDGSTDGTPTYLKNLHDPRIKVITQKNKGLGASLNRGVAMSSTEFIARMDADDISLPHRLQVQFDYMNQHKSVVMLGSQVAFISNERRLPGPRKPLNHARIRNSLMKGYSAMCHAACMFRTGVAREIGGYRIQRAGQDTDFFLRMCEAGKVANLDEILYLVRIHRNSVNYVARDDVIEGKAFAIECARCRQKAIPEPSFEEFQRKWEDRSLLRRAIRRVDSWSAVAYRHALLDLAESRQIRGVIRLGCAAACRPAGVARRISGRLCGWNNSS